MPAKNIGGEVKTQVIFTESAARKVYELIAEEGNFDLKLRVYITGGGCSGFQYGFTFDELVAEDDKKVTRHILLQEDNAANLSSDIAKVDVESASKSGTDDGEVTLLIDPMSFQYLKGAEIDYIEDVSGEQFIIRNPNAKTTCGCGSSFSI